MVLSLPSLLCLRQTSYFSSCFSTYPSSSPPPTLSPHPELSSIQCSDKEVEALLCSLKVKTSTGPDRISSYILQNTAYSISPSLCLCLCLCLCKVFNLSQLAAFQPIGSLQISLQFISLEIRTWSQIIDLSLFFPPLPSYSNALSIIRSYTTSILWPRQFGFRPGSST